MFETDRLLIRKCSLSDVDALLPILGDAEVMKYSAQGPLDKAGIVAYIEQILAHYDAYGYGLWGIICKELGEFVGLAGLIHQVIDNTAYVELAYRLARKYWGKGLAFEAANAIKHYAFEDLQLDRLISIIDPSNLRSIKVAENLGMIRFKSAIFCGFSVDLYDVWRIVLCPYDPKWAEIFHEEVKRLEAIFKKKSQFHHIGSTSIPGCDAKPVIDILGITNDVWQIDELNKPLEQIEYIPLGEFGMKQRRFFRKRDQVHVNLHIFEDSDPEIARHLRFRDYLRTHPEDRQRYSKLKRELASKHPGNIKQYIVGKESFVKEIDSQAAWQDLGKYWSKTKLVKKSEWSQSEILAAMEANMHLQMTYFAKYVAVMRMVFEPDVTVVISDIQDDTYNYVIGTRFDEKKVADRVSHILNLFEERPFSWWVSERDQPKSLIEELKRQGLSLKEEDMGMYLNLDGKNFARKIPNLEIKRALTGSLLQDFAKVMASIGGYALAYEHFYSNIPPVLYGEGAPYEIYVGYLEDRPVVTGILVLHANVGGIYYIMTDPSYRKRGYATEMMIFLLQRIQERDYHMATLQASTEGRSLYQKLGFEPNCQFLELSR